MTMAHLDPVRRAASIKSSVSRSARAERRAIRVGGKRVSEHQRIGNERHRVREAPRARRGELRIRRLSPAHVARPWAGLAAIAAPALASRQCGHQSLLGEGAEAASR